MLPENNNEKAVEEEKRITPKSGDNLLRQLGPLTPEAIQNALKGNQEQFSSMTKIPAAKGLAKSAGSEFCLVDHKSDEVVKSGQGTDQAEGPEAKPPSKDLGAKVNESVRNLEKTLEGWGQSFSDSVQKARRALEHGFEDLAYPLMATNGVSEQFAGTVRDGLDSVPKVTREALSQIHYKVEAVRDVAAYDKEHGTNLGTRRPPGYPPGDTYENCGAFFDKNNNTLVLCEYYTPTGAHHQDQSQKHFDIGGTVRHEMGHAYDDVRNHHFERDAQIQAMYKQDVARINSSPALRAELDYYVRPGSGLRETLAELYSIEHGNGIGSDDKKTDASLQKEFNDILNYIKKNGF